MNYDRRKLADALAALVNDTWADGAASEDIVAVLAATLEATAKAAGYDDLDMAEFFARQARLSLSLARQPRTAGMVGLQDNEPARQGDVY